MNTVSISRTASNDDSPDAIQIKIRVGKEIAYATLTLEQFALAVTGQTVSPNQCGFIQPPSRRPPPPADDEEDELAAEVAARYDREQGDDLLFDTEPH